MQQVKNKNGDIQIILHTHTHTRRTYACYLNCQPALSACSGMLHWKNMNKPLKCVEKTPDNKTFIVTVELSPLFDAA